MKYVTTFLIAIAALTLAACGGETSHAATTTAPPPPLPADVRELATAVIPSASEEPGREGELAATGEFVSPTRSEVAPKIHGRVARVFVDEGSRVAAGQPLLELETDYLRLNLQMSEAEAARAKAIRDEAQRDLGRKQELVAKGSIPQATFDRSQATFEQARAAHAAATAQVALLRQQIADSTVRSPLSGVVAEKRTDIGQKLGDNAVTFVVVQTSPLKLRFAVPERYLGRIHRGDRVVAHVDPYANEAFEGSIRTVGGVIDPQTRTMFAEAEFPNRDGRLRPGLFARVEIKLD
jgi:RND family efflux transporter MFP subunit